MKQLNAITLALIAVATAGLIAWPTAAQNKASPTAGPAPTAAPPLAALPQVSGEALAHTCAACHGTHGRLGDEAFMPLAGMPAQQMVATMQDFRSGKRPATLMGHVARGFTDADLTAMAAYFERQQPSEGSAAAFQPLRSGAPR